MGKKIAREALRINGYAVGHTRIAERAYNKKSSKGK